MYEMTNGLITFTCVCFGLSTTANNLQISNEKGTWSNSRDFCNRKITGKDVFNSCQPGTCRPNEIRGLKYIGLNLTVWISGYVERSQILQYDGCYGIHKSLKNSTIDVLPYKKEMQHNDVLECSRYCEQKEKIILLQETKKSWTNLFDFDEESTSSCNLSCPLSTGHYFCGGVDKDRIILSAYSYQDEPVAPDGSLGKIGQIDKIGQVCFFHDVTLDRISYGSCSEKKSFKCQKREDESTQTKSQSTYLDWYEARQKCRQQGAFLQTYISPNQKNEEVSKEDTWHNMFIIERILWDPETKPENPRETCLALRKTNHSKYEFLTENCSSHHSILCEIASSTGSTSFSSSTRSTSTGSSSFSSSTGSTSTGSTSFSSSTRSTSTRSTSTGSSSTGSTSFSSSTRNTSTGSTLFSFSTGSTSFLSETSVSTVNTVNDSKIAGSEDLPQIETTASSLESSSFSSKTSVSTANIVNDTIITGSDETPQTRDKAPIIIGSISSVVLISLCIVAVIIFRMKTRKKNSEHLPTKTDVNYSTVDESIKGATEFDHAQNLNVQDNEDVYNHLGDKAPTDHLLQEVNTCIYDHSGMNENEYDVSNSNWNSKNKYEDNAYADSRELQQVYDETSTPLPGEHSTTAF